MNTSAHSPVKFSTDTLLFLIAQELKIRRLFIGLQKAGFDDCHFEPHLDKLILSELGLDDGRDETLELYCRVVEKRSKKIKLKNSSVMKQARKVYRELVREKERRSEEIRQT